MYGLYFISEFSQEDSSNKPTAVTIMALGQFAKILHCPFKVAHTYVRVCVCRLCGYDFYKANQTVYRKQLLHTIDHSLILFLLLSYECEKQQQKMNKENRTCSIQ